MSCSVMFIFDVGADVVWRRGDVGQVHRQVLDKGRDMQIPEIVWDCSVTGDESETIPHLAAKDRNK